MNKHLFEKETPAERLNLLKNSCDTTETFNYSKPYGEEEMVVIKDRYAQNGIELQKIEEEKKEAIEGFKARMKPLEVEKNELLEGIKHKAKMVSETVYLMSDQKKGDMEYYNADGEMVYSRKLMPGERQLKIEAFKKEGTNN
jgi:hypothetical protein